MLDALLFNKWNLVMNVDCSSAEMNVTSTEQSTKQNETCYIMSLYMIYHIISYHYQSLYMIWQTYHIGFLIWYHYITELYQKPLKDRHTWVGCWWVGDGQAVLTGNLWDLPWILLYFAPPPHPHTWSSQSGTPLITASLAGMYFSIRV